MFKQFVLGVFLLVFTTVKAQELNCSVTVNADQIQVSNNQIFKTLENALTELINQTKWTDVKYAEHERVKCAITLLLTEQSGSNTFTGTLQVQASRPVFNSEYYSPIFNFKDNTFSFNYTEFQPLNFNPNIFESNLVSAMSYYSYLILGIYGETFKNKGGDKELKSALNIANQAQQSGSGGWGNKRSEITRFTMIDQWLTGSNDALRKLYYTYHYDCLDSFERNQGSSINKLLKSLLTLKEIHNSNPNNILIRILLDAKADEIVNIFRKDRSLDTDPLISILKKVSPVNSKKWRQIYSN